MTALATSINIIKVVLFRNPKLRISSRTTAILIPILWLGLLLFSCQDPPMGALERAKGALNRAETAGALRYNEDNYRDAEKLIKDGWMEMAHQNGRLAPFRNYSKADSLLYLAFRTAYQAESLTVSIRSNLDSLARSERDEFRRELKNWREVIDGSLNNFQAEWHWTAAEMALQIAENLMAKAEYEEALENLKRGRRELALVENSIAEYQNDAAQKIGVWRRWVNETLSQSRTAGSYAVIIDKTAHKAYLVRGGELFQTYKCEVGYNSGRQKLFAGDGSTPEGVYYVTKAKRASKFYRALLINYPNQQDLSRLRDNKAKGVISRYSRAGALIEIHGEGGKNTDWTDGCVALTNRDIEQLMQYATVGTPVTIVRRSDQWP
jgi:L,D-peptidoglycan transpeptidase YkuD (ErfK/YbiS/YcfS/YnhG family)